MTYPKISLRALTCSLCALLLVACAHEKYEAKPISAEQVNAKLVAKDPLSEHFKAYLLKQGYADSDLPFKTWGLNELTLSALYHHPKLDVAKAHMALANASLATAGQKQNPILSGTLARSNRANNDIRPWAYGLNVEIPIETANKRAIRQEEAEHLAEIAHIDVADVAWQLRTQIAQDLLRYHHNVARQQRLQAALDQQGELLKLLEKRVKLGNASNTELGTVRLTQQKAQSALNVEQTSLQEIRAALAADAGLTLDKFNQLSIRPLDIYQTLALQATKLDPPDSFKDLQEKTLLNRLDVRRALEKYAAAEAKIKLEVAKQTPDIALTPGFIFEFGDKIWSLGFASLLNLLNKNQTLIAEAKQLREIEGAQFETLQAQTIANLNQAHARYMAAQTRLSQAQQSYSAELLHLQRLHKQLDAGLIDRLELTYAKLSVQNAEEQVLNAQFDSMRAASDIENIMQYPIFDHFSMPAHEAEVRLP